MAFPSPLVQENTAQGIPGGARSTYQVGVNDIDPGTIVEQALTFPWMSDPSNTVLDFSSWFETQLDPGIVVHRQMPQTVQDVDELGTASPYSTAYAASKTGGPNLVSKGAWEDTIQRMANSKYDFAFVGYCVRVGYQPVIPRVLKIGDVEAVPNGPQQVVGPMIVTSYSGIPVYFASWRIPYTVTIPPKQSQMPPPNLAAHVAAVEPDNLPTGISVPISPPDSNSVRSGPQPRVELLTGIPQEATR